MPSTQAAEQHGARGGYEAKATQIRSRNVVEFIKLDIQCDEANKIRSIHDRNTERDRDREKDKNRDKWLWSFMDIQLHR